MPVNNGTLLKFYNCSILRNGKLIKEDLWVRNGKIVDPEKIFYDEKIDAETLINCQGALISPGYIDVQINGEYLSIFFPIFISKLLIKKN